MPETWTIAQAASIVGTSLDAFQKAVDRAPVKPRLMQRGGRRVRAFELPDLVFFCALDTLKRELTPAKQGEVYEALRRVPLDETAPSVEVGQLKYDFSPFVSRIRSNIELSEKRLELIDMSARGPLIKGTGIEVYRIAALLEGMNVDEILADYPSLDRRQVLAAKFYAESHPKAGRPFPKLTVKKAMREPRAPDVDAFLPTRE